MYKRNARHNHSNDTLYKRATMQCSNCYANKHCNPILKLNDKTHPIGIIHQTDLLRRAFPIPNLTPTRINPLAVIIPLTYTPWHVCTFLKMYTLPCTYLTVNVLETQWEECRFGGGFVTDAGAVDAAAAEAAHVHH